MGRRRSFLKALGAGAGAAVTGAAGCTDDTSQNSDDVTSSTFDFIVVGSGAGGGPLASNLARAGHKVLLLEAGEDHGSLEAYQVPAFHTKASEEPSMSWNFFVKHYEDADQAGRDSKLTDKGVLYPRAGTLGGCTAHNALITVYPHESDWDHIADLTGDESWRPHQMRRYFEILEHCDYLGSKGRAGHGFTGWLHTRQPDARVALQDKKLIKIVTATALEVDVTQGGGLLGTLNQVLFQNELFSLMGRDLNTADPSRDQTEGLFTIPMHANGGVRNGPREFILDTIAQGFPLTLRTNALVTRVVFSTTKVDGKIKATSVEYLEGAHLYRADPKPSSTAGKKKTVTAKKEIILSAGVYNTPQLLKLSGIGPKAELKTLGIKLLLDKPGVGENLQDRYEVGIVSEASSDFSALNGCTFGAASGDPCLDSWHVGKGVYGNNGAVVAIVKRSTDEQPDPDLIIFGLTADFRGYYPGYSKDLSSDHKHFTWAILKGHTLNHGGSVKLKSKDPLDVPDINFRYFHEGTTENGEDEIDLDAVAEGVDMVRRINDRIGSLMLFTGYDEVWPGPDVSDRDQVRSFIRDEAWGHHASCTAKIGADDDPMAVLDSKFLVRGTANLRVVDACVFPRIPGFFIVVPIYMIAEKATDDILATLGESRS